jgi:hypothetical protein
MKTGCAAFGSGRNYRYTCKIVLLSLTQFRRAMKLPSGSYSLLNFRE